MTITVTIPSTYSYDNTSHTYTDDSNPTTGLDGGGHVTRFLPAIKDVLSMVEYVATSNVVGDIALAQVSATSAGNSASSAQGYALEAQNYSLAITATSTTSLTIGMGSKTLTVGANKAFKIGQYVTIAQTSTPTNFMVGQVTAYSSSTLTVSVVTIGGSGTATAWTVSMSGVPGTVIGGLSPTVDNGFTVDQTINTVKVGTGSGTGINNTRVGNSSGDNLTSGNNNTLLGKSTGNALNVGFNNSVVGSLALTSADNSNNNTVVGHKALQIYSDYNGGNVAVGSEAGLVLSAGSNNTYIGYQAGSSMVTYSNSGAFGYYAMPAGSNQIRIGNSSATVYTQSGTVSASDERDKTDIRDTQLGLSFINSLRPVDYKWDIRIDYAPEKPEQGDMTDEQYKAALHTWSESCKPANLTHNGSKKRNRYHHGLIAQELGSLLQTQGIEFGGYQDFEVNGGEAMQAVVYEELIAPMIKAIQELSARIVVLENR